MCEEMAGIEKAGAATGIFMMSGNAGAVVVIALIPILSGEETLWTKAIYLLLALMLITLALVAVPLKETILKEKAA